MDNKLLHFFLDCGGVVTYSDSNVHYIELECEYNQKRLETLASLFDLVIDSEYDVLRIPSENNIACVEFFSATSLVIFR